MSFDEIQFINTLLRYSVEKHISWKLVNFIPPILHTKTEITITSCYVSDDTDNGKFYLFQYREPEYSGEYDKFFNVEKTGLVLLNNDQITWKNTSNSIAVYNLYNYVSTEYSGINNILSKYNNEHNEKKTSL
ncbi:hypothetical protein [Pasteurella sp. PK-2025]|uniref:hypothetical protein n=1 Tax=Pasteurella sp. PK-2025 TaxID=3413133 RepID=UPI003C74C35D